ncbi:MAG: BON domain-containing protein [Bdellovibrionales bacterium]|nr:BON domain-containing protein [Bdellovibrionales bacterium]
MEMYKNFRNLTRLFLALSVFVFSSFVFANKTKKNITLSVGIPYSESVPNMPSEFDTSGTYKGLTQLEYNAATKILRFSPKKEGFGTLVITDKRNKKTVYEFTVDIRKTDLAKVSREIKTLLNEIEGITISIANNRVVVDGQILLPNDMKRIHSVVKQYGELATSLVTLSPAAQVKIAQFIERAIGNPEIHVKAVNGKFMLEGTADDQKEKDRAEIIAKTYVPDVIVDEAVADKKVQERISEVVINLIAIRPSPEAEPSKIVQIVVHYVELQKDFTKGFRFQWTPDIGDGSKVSFSSGDRTPAGLTSTITGTISNLLPKLNWAKEHGHARVLQSSSIIVEDAKPGTLNSIQNIPYQIVTADGLPSTSFAEAGIRTTITPQIIGSRSDSISLKLAFSVKSLIGMTAQGPLTSSREINTQIVVRSGQSAAVGGLISSDTSTGYNKLPANASANPLISLYSSKDFRRNQSQFVVFVTPIIKASASTGTENIKRKFRLRD